MKFSEVKNVLERLHTKDTDVLPRIGLGKLSQSFHSYSVRHSETSLIVLVAVNIVASKISSLTENEAKASVVILEGSDFKKRKWVKIWPKEAANKGNMDDEDIDISMAK